MKKWYFVSGGIIFVAVLALFAKPAQSDISALQLERGKYLVHNASLCVQCHSPRDGQGRLVESEFLKGGPIPISSPWRNENWATVAPSLRAMSGYTEEQAVRFLTTGITRRGVPAQSPMPPFRLSEEDAKAIFAYLSSI